MVKGRIEGVSLCNECARTKTAKNWMKKDIQTAIIEILHSNGMNARKIELEPISEIGRKQLLKAKITLESGEEEKIDVMLRVILCDMCSLKNRNYFEGVLQLRNPDERVESFIRKDINANKDRGIFITKEVPMKDGTDFYLTSQKYLRTLGKKLASEYSGELKMSRKLFTQDSSTSKHVYRVNVYFRLLPFKEGKEIIVRGEKIKIKRMGRRIEGIRLSDGKKVSYPMSDVVKEIKKK